MNAALLVSQLKQLDKALLDQLDELNPLVFGDREQRIKSAARRHRALSAIEEADHMRAVVLALIDTAKRGEAA